MYNIDGEKSYWTIKYINALVAQFFVGIFLKKFSEHLDSVGGGAGVAQGGGELWGR